MKVLQNTGSFEEMVLDLEKSANEWDKLTPEEKKVEHEKSVQHQKEIIEKYGPMEMPSAVFKISKSNKK